MTFLNVKTVINYQFYLHFLKDCFIIFNTSPLIIFFSKHKYVVTSKFVRLSCGNAYGNLH
jgi:hypothetical protein